MGDFDSDQNTDPPEENSVEAVQESDSGSNGGMSKEARQWAMALHFSLLAGYVIPGIGAIIVPILIWQLKKDDFPEIVPHAHVVMNWLVNMVVFGVVCFILMFVIIGIFGFIALGIMNLVFSIMGGIKANDGELWEYPFTLIKVFK